MLARILATVFLLITASPVWAACTNLYQSHVVNLLNNAPLPGASVTVYLYGTTTKATIYDLTCTPISNPMTADSNALASFKADGSTQYQVQWQYGSYVSPGYYYFPSTYTPGASSSTGFYATGAYSSGFTSGLYMDYASNFARFSVATGDGFKWFKGGVGTTPLMTLDTNGALTPLSFAPAAGTTTQAPFKFTSGTNLTTAVAGSFEYDGKVAYFTPQSIQRGVVPGVQFYRLDSNLAGANVNTAQSMFGVGATLSSSTVYAFEITAAFTKSAGTTSHSFSIGFGGTATLNNLLYQGHVSAASVSYSSGTFSGTAVSMNATTATLVVTGIATAGASVVVTVRGTVSVNAGGTLIPQYTLSAAPGGAYSTVAGSYISIYPIGASGANVNVGNWQ
jgi:hypothetical protein